MSSNVSHVWLTVYQHRDWASSSVSQLWWRRVVHHFAPQVGQRMAMLYSDEEPSGSWHNEVVDVYFDFGGLHHITMQSVIVDPDAEGEKAIYRSISTSNPRNRRGRWETERDGDLDAMLLACGWQEYIPEEYQRWEARDR